MQVDDKEVWYDVHLQVDDVVFTLKQFLSLDVGTYYLGK